VVERVGAHPAFGQRSHELIPVRYEAHESPARDHNGQHGEQYLRSTATTGE